MNNIKKLSRILLLALNALIVLTPLALVAWWIMAYLKSAGLIDLSLACIEQVVHTPDGFVNLFSVTWTPRLWLLGLLSDVISIAPFWLSLFLLKRLFTNYANSDIFTRSNALIYRSLGYLLLIDALVTKLLSETLLVVAATLANPNGSGYLTFSFGTPSLASLFYSLIVIVVSQVMLEASRLHDEQQLTI